MERISQQSRFDARTSGKGSAEWAAFSAVKNDRVSMFEVSKPKQLMTIDRMRRFLDSMRATGSPSPNRRLRGAH